METIKWVSNDTLRAINTRHMQLVANGDDTDAIIGQLVPEFGLTQVNHYDEHILFFVRKTEEYVAVEKDVPVACWYNEDWEMGNDDDGIPFSIFAIAENDNDLMYRMGVEHGVDDRTLAAWGCNEFPSVEGKGIVLAIKNDALSVPNRSYTYANPDKDKRIKTINGDNSYSDLDYFEGVIYENSDGHQYAYGWGGARSLFGVNSPNGGTCGRSNAFVLLG